MSVLLNPVFSAASRVHVVPCLINICQVYNQRIILEMARTIAKHSNPILSQPTPPHSHVTYLHLGSHACAATPATAWHAPSFPFSNSVAPLGFPYLIFYLTLACSLKIQSCGNTKPAMEDRQIFREENSILVGIWQCCLCK